MTKNKEALRKKWREQTNRCRAKKSVAERIVIDSKGSDRKGHRSNDLTLEYVSALIANGCSYCGETTLRMTLDRVDNAIGHTKVNVVPACIRCNYLRRDMPFTTWMFLVPRVKEAVALGLFGTWIGGVWK